MSELVLGAILALAVRGLVARAGKAAAHPDPRFAERKRWVPGSEWAMDDWKVEKNPITMDAYAGVQLRVGIYHARRGPPRLRVWSQFWAWDESAADFMPTESVFTFESDELVEKIMREYQLRRRPPNNQE